MILFGPTRIVKLFLKYRYFRCFEANLEPANSLHSADAIDLKPIFARCRQIS